MTTVTQARQWLDRWDRQQEQYLADREQRFTVIGDVLAAVLDRDDPLVLDLGAGPGSLSARLMDRWPRASVVAIDADPLLLGLAELAYRRPGFRTVEYDLRTDGWVQALGLARAPDAIVSTTALHWLTLPELGSVYARCGELLAAGGVFVNGDHLSDAPNWPRLAAAARAVQAAHDDRLGRGGADHWGQWWQAVEAAPELAELRRGRPAIPISHTVPDVPGLHAHCQLLRDAGFSEVGTVWQHGEDRVLVAMR